MTDSAQDFYDDVVAPSIDEFRVAEEELANAYVEKNEERMEAARALVMRRARTAAVELHQFADRVEAERPTWAPAKNPEGLRE